MTMLQRFYPGDAATWTAVIILAHVTMVIIVALMLERCVKRFGAAARCGVWFCALVGAAVFPLLTIVGNQVELSIVSISVPSDFSSPPESEHASESESDNLLRPAAEESDPPEEDHGPLASPVNSDHVVTGGVPKETVPAVHHVVDPPPARVNDITKKASVATSETLTEREKKPTVASQPSAESRDRTTAAANSKDPSTPRDGFQAAVGAVTLVWIGGVLILLVRLLGGFRWIGVLRRVARPLDDRYAAILAQVKERLDGRHPGIVVISRFISVPMVIGIWRPMVLIPEHLRSVLRESELEDVLVYECAHIVRGDLVVGLLQRLVALLYWPHPLIHVLNRRLSRAREEICDNYALRGSNARRYAGTLLTVAEHTATATALSAGISLLPSHWKLDDRVAGLLDKGRNLMTRTNRFFLVSLMAALTMIGIVFAGVRLGEAAPGTPGETAAETAPTGAGKPHLQPPDESNKKSNSNGMKERYRFEVWKVGPFRTIPIIEEIVAVNEPFNIRRKFGATATSVLQKTVKGALRFKAQVSQSGRSAVIDAPVELGKGGFFAPMKGGPDSDGFDSFLVSITLSHAFENVPAGLGLGVSGKRGQLVVVPGPKPKNQRPSEWFNSRLKPKNNPTPDKETWLLFRSKQLNRNDRM